MTTIEPSETPVGDVPAAAASLDLSANHFGLFEQPVTFEIDESGLAARYRRLQELTHPDRFAAGSDAERRWSMQASGRVNDAYTTLRKPLARAIYLLSLNGVSTDEETDTRMAPAFLMAQMELREAIDEAPSAADPFAAIEGVRTELVALRRGCRERFAAASVAASWREARDVVREWQFVDKLEREVVSLEARLDDEADAG